MKFVNTRMNRKIDVIRSDTMEALARYDWPGNVRELQNPSNITAPKEPLTD